MVKCLNIHEHKEFKQSYNPANTKHTYEVKKLKRFLLSDSGNAIGEYLKHGFDPFKSFPRGGVALRCLFVLCRDCKKEKLDVEKCGFCKTDEHTEQDAVLFLVGDTHEVSYGKEGKRIRNTYLASNETK